MSPLEVATTFRILQLGSILIATIGVVGLFFAILWWEIPQIIGSFAIIGLSVAWWRVFGHLTQTRSNRAAA